ncbi:unnamed protein product [Linum tenue]|uniref:Kiwellin n=1 Tax=Linum tenue TaxID=586396 RepID=A0AAV0N348_9ROSI|nr:unnamed protein product [Linum tenue]
MGKLPVLLPSVFFPFLFFFIVVYLASPSAAAPCNAPCRSESDCDGNLACIGGRCADDPDVGTTICPRDGKKAPPSTPKPAPRSGGGGGTCEATGTLSCGRKTFKQFTCSPPVTSITKATLSLNEFGEGGSGGSPSQCDEKFHSDNEAVVALSTGWYDGGSRCGKKIKITAQNGRSVFATVVDQCDSVNGCDREHANLPPCDNNIVDGSAAVWRALRLNQNLGRVPVTWAMA